MRIAGLLLSCLLFAGPASAQPAPAAPPAELPPLPAEMVTSHVVAGRSGPIAFNAVAGAVRLPPGAAPAEAQVATLGFLRTEGGPHPVTFVVNGGPGAASAWLNLGAIGPWRVDASASTVSPSATPTLLDNADTWLDMTDLVFVDPPGTGYSRIAPGEAVRRRLWSVNGDIDALADVMHRWLAAHGRLGATVYVLGESYGGFRAPRLARALTTRQGVGVRGIAMLSPVIDFSHRNELWDPMPCVFALPSQVAASRAERGAAPERADVADAEAYAMGDYLHDAWQGPRDPAALARMIDHVTALLPGIDPALIRQQEGCVDKGSFVRSLHRDARRVGSVYDTTVTAADPFPAASRSFAPDPALDDLQPLFIAGMQAEYERLHWQPDGPYQLLAGDVFRQWQWGNSPNSPESYLALRTALAADPAFHAVVVHGLFDLVTPYMADKVLIDSVPDLGPPGRLILRVHPGGHMFYTRDASRAALHDDGAWLFGASGR